MSTIILGLLVVLIGFKWIAALEREAILERKVDQLEQANNTLHGELILNAEAMEIATVAVESLNRRETLPIGVSNN